jgi:glycerate-2-kinase
MTPAKTNWRETSTNIWQSGVDGIHPDSVIPQAVAGLIKDSDHKDLLILGGGKAGAAMVRALVRAIPTSVRLHGLLNVPEDQAAPMVENHPIVLHGARPAGSNHPTEAGVRGSRQQIALAQTAPVGCAGMCLLSGGASALMPLPCHPVTLEEKLLVTKILHDSGADITLLNATRKHLSAIKGGRLASAWVESPSGKAGWPLITLAISDVIGDDPSVIGSGPTVPDPTTFESTWRELLGLGVTEHLPIAVKNHFLAGCDGSLQETPKVLPSNIHYHLLGNNTLALKHAANTAQKAGFETQIIEPAISGPVDVVAKRIVSDIRSKAWADNRAKCLLWGGEPTVVVPPGSGLGGRNQELALRLTLLLTPGELGRITLLCAGTDGEDGPTDAAGGFADSISYESALQQKLNISESLTRHDSYHALSSMKSLFRTGWTGTNVADIVVAIIRNQHP